MKERVSELASQIHQSTSEEDSSDDGNAFRLTRTKSINEKKVKKKWKPESKK